MQRPFTDYEHEHPCVHAHTCKGKHGVSNLGIVFYTLSLFLFVKDSLGLSVCLSLSLSLSETEPSSYFNTHTHIHKVCFFRSLSRPNTFAGAPSLMLAQLGDKCLAVKKAVALIFAQLRPPSKVLK